MNKTSPKSLKRSTVAMTLIEVVGSLALVSLVLTGVLLARARAMAKWSMAQQRIEATTVADTLLSQWWEKPGNFPIGLSGPVPKHPGLRWFTCDRTERLSDVAALGLRLVRVEVRAVGSVTEEPLVFVDVVVPNANTCKLSP